MIKIIGINIRALDRAGVKRLACINQGCPGLATIRAAQETGRNGRVKGSVRADFNRARTTDFRILIPLPVPAVVIRPIYAGY